MKNTISIIIPTYNRSRLLSYTLDSILAQTVDKNNLEVIVADDGSCDDTQFVVNKYVNKLNIKYLYQADRGYRPGSARNMGIVASESEICLLIDSGVLLHERCVSEHILFHQLNKSSAAIGYVYGFEESDDHADELKQVIVPSEVGKSIQRLATIDAFSDVRNQHYSKYNYVIENLPAPWYYFWTCHVSAKRKDLLHVNMFDPAFDTRWGAEDNDLGYRLHQIGIKICLLKEAESIHYPHPKNKTSLHQEGYENAKYFDRKYQTVESSLFFTHFMDDGFFDLNDALIKLKKDTIVSQYVE